ARGSLTAPAAAPVRDLARRVRRPRREGHRLRAAKGHRLPAALPLSPRREGLGATPQGTLYPTRWAHVPWTRFLGAGKTARKALGSEETRMSGLTGAAERALLGMGGLLRRAEVSADGRTLHRVGGRQADAFYRDRWSYDKVVRSTHGVNCTGSCSWKVYVKDGIITWEAQQTDYPSVGEIGRASCRESA